TLANIRDNVDLRETFRQSMLNRIEPALRNVTEQGAVIRREQEERLVLLAKARQLQQATEARLVDEERTRERMRVFRHLMDQGRFEEAYKQGLVIQQDAVNQGIPVPVAVTAAVDMGLITRHLREEQTLVEL